MKNLLYVPEAQNDARGLFSAGNVADCMQETEEAMVVFLTQPAKSVQDGRGAVPKTCTPTKYSEGASQSVCYDAWCRKINLLQYNMDQG